MANRARDEPDVDGADVTSGKGLVTRLAEMFINRFLCPETQVSETVFCTGLRKYFKSYPDFAECLVECAKPNA